MPPSTRDPGSSTVTRPVEVSSLTRPPSTSTGGPSVEDPSFLPPGC
uniref:Uncharacterized protein n=1 Tax=Timema tahoe TaxID=61484 RepID=A0A7R9IUQ7_9NEOP|nr:unnamed protein product [Timema tahoe]